MPRRMDLTSSDRTGFGRPFAVCALEIEATRRASVATESAPACWARYSARTPSDAVDDHGTSIGRYEPLRESVEFTFASDE